MIPEPLKKGYSIYGAKYCEYCQKAKKWCFDNDMTFMYVNINEIIDNNTELFNYFGQSINNQKTIPIIFKDGNFIGGWTDLMDLNKKNAKLELHDDF
jgi:glutaredoxin 3